ncbi:MAG: hypothetical protein WC301_05595, partial [Candidatus Omnitrophota bacterium]
NYQQIKDTLDRKGIQLVCVQYPMCPIEPLKRMLAGKEDVIFVDNERIFRNAVDKEGYEEYFIDMFGGNFGHCNEKGNRLLAENIADSIIKRYFKE